MTKKDDEKAKANLPLPKGAKEALVKHCSRDDPPGCTHLGCGDGDIESPEGLQTLPERPRELLSEHAMTVLNRVSLSSDGALQHTVNTHRLESDNIESLLQPVLRQQAHFTALLRPGAFHIRGNGVLSDDTHSVEEDDVNDDDIALQFRTENDYTDVDETFQGELVEPDCVFEARPLEIQPKRTRTATGTFALPFCLALVVTATLAIAMLLILRTGSGHSSTLPGGGEVISLLPSLAPSGMPSNSPTLEPVIIASKQELLHGVLTYIRNDQGGRPKGLPIGLWDVSRVRDLSSVFSRRVTFNEDLSGWDVSRVTNFQGTFLGAQSFNQDLTAWNTSSAETMSFMFMDSSSFNGNISTWDVSNVRRMPSMFKGAHSFDQDLSPWNVGRVLSFNRMFDQAFVFDGNIGNWNTSSVTDTVRMFHEARSFNQDLNWDVSKVRTFRSMVRIIDCFARTSNLMICSLFDEQFNSPTISVFNGDLSRWSTSKATDMAHMFGGAVNYNSPMNDWIVSRVQSFERFLEACFAFNQPLDRWKTNRANTMERMFTRAGVFNQDLSDWDVSAVITFTAMFLESNRFNGSLANWNPSSAEDMYEMFSGADSFDQDLSSFRSAKLTSTARMFTNSHAFTGKGIEYWDFGSVEIADSMFLDATRFNNVELSRWNVSSLRNANSMFRRAESFTGIGLADWNVSSLATATTAFMGATSFNESICSWRDHLDHPFSVFRDWCWQEVFSDDSDSCLPCS